MERRGFGVPTYDELRVAWEAYQVIVVDLYAVF